MKYRYPYKNIFGEKLSMRNFICCTGLTLPNKKFLHWSKLKALHTTKKYNIKAEIFLEWIENIVGRKCWLPAFSPFPTMFSKGFFIRVVKSRDCVLKG